MPETITREQYAALSAQAKPNKYGAIKDRIDGYSFDSMKEADYYVDVIRPLLWSHNIMNLEVHKRYDCVVNGILVCKYEADFDYDWVKSGVHDTIDVKGFKTREYKLKKKLMAACHPTVKITEV
jgi:Protein of unknown function (DUF1064)